MKISGEKPIVDLEASLKSIDKKAEQAAHQGQSPAERASSTEKVYLSDKAKEIKKVKKIIESVPDVREDKVQLIKDQLEKGIYNVNGEKVADKLLQEALIDFFL